MKNQITFDLSSAILSLKKNQVVTLPTETVEGYAVALSSSQGIQSLMEIKSRGFDSDKIFTLVPESIEAIPKYVTLSDKTKNLIYQYFPGELTIILPKNPLFRHFYYDHFQTIGIRIPDHPIFPAIQDSVGAILLTSANPRGGTPKSITGHLPSTIIDCSINPPKILRQGNLKIKTI